MRGVVRKVPVRPDVCIAHTHTHTHMAYFLADEADSEWLLIGAILVFFMRESRVPCPGQPSRVPTSPRVC